MGILLASLAAILGASSAARPRPPRPSAARRPARQAPRGGKRSLTRGQTVYPRGMSTMDCNGREDSSTRNPLPPFAKDWKVDLVRLAMYVGEGGSSHYPAGKSTLIKGNDLALSLGLLRHRRLARPQSRRPERPDLSGAEDFFRDIAASTVTIPMSSTRSRTSPTPISWELDIQPYPSAW
jgi:endoglucanase